jgi:hypothetical protein
MNLLIAYDQIMQTEKNTKDDIFWDVTQCGSCKNRRFGGTYRLYHQSEKISQLGKVLALTSNKCSF